MKASNLLTICLLMIISTQAWGSRLFWLKTYGAGSLSFWQNKNLPNTTNLCRNGVGMGSKLYWDSCTYDPANPSVLLPGTKANWEKGFGPGSKNYWHTVIAPFNGMGQAQMCTSPFGYKPGMKLYYTHCTGPGSKAYWTSGVDRGSSIYWRAGKERSISADWVGPCMDTDLAQEVVWCKQMNKDVLLQNASILDWSSSVAAFVNQIPCSNNASHSPYQQESLHNLVNTVMSTATSLVDPSQISESQTDDRK